MEELLLSCCLLIFLIDSDTEWIDFDPTVEELSFNKAFGVGRGKNRVVCRQPINVFTNMLSTTNETLFYSEEFSLGI